MSSLSWLILTILPLIWEQTSSAPLPLVSDLSATLISLHVLRTAVFIPLGKHAFNLPICQGEKTSLSLSFYETLVLY